MKALVTGAASGIGKALCERLAKEGYTVIPVTREVCDLSKSRSELIALIHREVPDLIVNCAGFGIYGPAVENSTQAQLELLEVNCNAVFEMTVEGAKALLQSGKKGTICNISSAAAFLIFPHFAAYAASKACVNHFSQSLDVELKPKGIRVLAACPGQVSTGFRQRAAKGKLQGKPFHSMPVEEAADHIYRQIQKGKRLNLFNFSDKLLIALAKVTPKPLLQRLLRANIDSR